MKLELKDLVVVITGASQGIGAASAREFAKHGCRVALAARSENLLKEIATEIQKQGGHALPVKTDVSNVEDIKKLGQIVLENWGRIDIWINNAGFTVSYDSLTAKEEWVNQLFRVNLLAVYWGMRVAAQAMMQNQSKPRGIIVNISSIASELQVAPRITLYKATKLAVDTLGEGIDLELAPLDIKVLTIKPGFIASNFGYNMLGRQSDWYKKHGIDPEKVAQKIVAEVEKAKSNQRVLVTKRDRIFLFAAKLFDYPLRYFIRQHAQRRKPDQLTEN